jgi:hypothetical protein
MSILLCTIELRVIIAQYRQSVHSFRPMEKRRLFLLEQIPFLHDGFGHHAFKNGAANIGTVKRSAVQNVA